ncbi:hypothetical protein KGF56_003208 [Candida oxycetoniae]|uniref:Major facilitator superfamily (MFS) profile domain-containing protein n=1 Tax=Candida oxycetoniae TaxID=497107 RepID=A0AAI9WXJ0_9ASCO|nr:uncharacterized protein KGF56_003208 [Candida oxycetoniae]KAI3404049.1 hypothetical protein KGF56_003208 [Candida oxycetoniae]
MSATANTKNNFDFPPGTVHLVDLEGTLNVKKADSGDIILHPQPSSNVNDPLRWSKRKRNLQFGLVWFWAFMLAVSINFMGPLFVTWIDEWNSDFQMMGVAVAFGFLFLGVGILFVQPTGLKLGKQFVYNVCTIIIIVGCIIGSFSTNIGYLLVFKVLAGISAAPVDTLVEITSTDLYFQHERSTAFSSLIFALYAGSFLGPVACGYIADNLPWEWCYYIQIIIYVPLLVIQIIWMEDTTFRRSDNEEEALEEGILTQLKSITSGEAVASEAKDGKDNAEIEVKTDDDSTHSSQVEYTWAHKRNWVHTEQNDIRSWMCIFLRPFYLITFPAVVWGGLIYGFQMFWLSLLVNTQGLIYEAAPYNFSVQNVGLTNVAVFVGNCVGMFYGGQFVDWFAVKMAKRNNGILEPEHRLQTMVVPTIINAAGILAYGLGSHYGAHWAISVVIGQGFMGFAMSSSGSICLVYAVESYSHLASESLVLMLFIRNMIGMCFTFGISPWITAQGLMGSTYVMFGLSLIINGSYLIFTVWGKSFRRWTRERYEKIRDPLYGEYFKKTK